MPCVRTGIQMKRALFLLLESRASNFWERSAEAPEILQGRRFVPCESSLHHEVQCESHPGKL